MAKEKEEELTLEEITQPEYMQLINESTQALERQEEKYLAKIDTIKKYITDLYCQYRTTQMYEMDSNVKYFFDSKSGELSYKTTKRPKYIGFNDEA